MINAHHSYLHETRHPATGERIFRIVTRLSPRAAWELAVNADPEWVSFTHARPYEYPGDEAFVANQGLVNKGFILLGVNPSGIVATLYNHDGKYYLAQAKADQVLDHLVHTIQIIGPSSTPYPTQALAEDLALQMVMQCPWEQSPASPSA